MLGESPRARDYRNAKVLLTRTLGYHTVATEAVAGITIALDAAAQRDLPTVAAAKVEGFNMSSWRARRPLTSGARRRALAVLEGVVPERVAGADFDAVYDRLGAHRPGEVDLVELYADPALFSTDSGGSFRKRPIRNLQHPASRPAGRKEPSTEAQGPLIRERVKAVANTVEYSDGARMIAGSLGMGCAGGAAIEVTLPDSTQTIALKLIASAISAVAGAAGGYAMGNFAEISHRFSWGNLFEAWRRGKPTWVK